VLLGLLAALPALSIDISTPTLPLLPAALGTSTMMAEFTLSLFMVGFAFGQLAGGRQSDRRGRRPVLLAGLAAYTLAGIGCALSLSGPALVMFRCVQGLGAGACSVLSFAIVQDLFHGDIARTKRSYVVVVVGVVPILAPAMGSGLSVFAGWRSVHWVLALGGAILSAITWFGIAETRQRPPAAMVPVVTSRPVRLRDDRYFVGLAMANALSYGAIFAYIAGSPIVIIGSMGFSSVVFAAVFACTAAALTAGAWTSGRVGRRGLGASALLGPSLWVATAATLVLAVESVGGAARAALLLLPLLITLFARGVTAPNLQHLAIERRREQAGAASAAIGVSQLLSGALASVIVSLFLPGGGASAVAVPMAVLAALALLIWLWTVRRHGNSERLPEERPI